MEKPNVLQGLANPANYDFPEGLCLPSSFQEGKNRRKKRGGFYLINDFVLVPLGSPLSQSKDQRTYAPFENHGRNNPDNPEAEDNSQQVPEHDADNPHAEHGGDGGETSRSPAARRADGVINAIDQRSGVPITEIIRQVKVSKAMPSGGEYIW